MKNFSVIDCPQIAYLYGLFVRRASGRNINVSMEHAPEDYFALMMEHYVPCNRNKTKITMRSAALLVEANDGSAFANVPEELVPYFVRGVFDHFGSTSMHPAKWTVKFDLTGQYDFVKPIHEWFVKMGVNVSLIETVTKSWSVHSSSKPELNKIFDLLFCSDFAAIDTLDKNEESVQKFRDATKPVVSQSFVPVHPITELEKIPGYQDAFPLSSQFGEILVSEETLARMIKFYNDGVSFVKIADMYHCTNGFIAPMLEKRGVIARDMSECHRKYPIYEDFFDVIDTEEKAYILGFIWADGCNHLKNNYVSINISAVDKELLEKISRNIYVNNCEDRISQYVRKRVFNKGTPEERLFDENTIKLTINSKHICGKLNDLGCTPRKSLTCTFPTTLSTDDLKRHFIRGYFDGDGSIYSNKMDTEYSIKFIGTLETMSSIRDFVMDQIGVHFTSPNRSVPTKFLYDENDNLISEENVNCFSIYTSGNQQVKRFVDWLYKDATIFMQRKYFIAQALDKRIDWVQNGVDKNYVSIFAEEQIEEMKKLAESGKSFQDVAKEMKVNKYELADTLRNAGIVKTRSQSNQTVSPLDEKMFDVIDTSDKAYFLGIFFGCGAHTYHDNQIAFESSQNKDLIQGISDFVYGVGVKPINEKSSYRFSIRNKYISNSLKNIGCVDDRDSRQIPMDKIQPEYQKDFLRGYFECKGSFYKASTTSATICASMNGTKENLDLIKQYIVANFGTEWSEVKPITKGSTANKYKLYSTDNAKVLQWKIHLYDTGGLDLGTHKNRYEVELVKK